MNTQNLKPILLSVVALILLSLSVGFTVFYAGTLLRASDAPAYEDPSSAPSEQPSLPETPVAPTDGQPTPSTPDRPEQPAYLLKETADGGTEYLSGLVFLGDSTTYGMIGAEVLPDKKDTRQVWYGPNGTLTLPSATAHLLNDGSLAQGVPLAQITKENRPDILVITLGVGVSYSISEDLFKQAYSLIVDTVLNASPETKIICQSIYPVCSTISSSYAKINNEDIRKCNAWLEDFVAQRNAAGTKIYFVDAYALLADENGDLPVNFSNGDGLHLSKAAFEKILLNLRTHRIEE